MSASYFLEKLCIHVPLSCRVRVRVCISYPNPCFLGSQYRIGDSWTYTAHVILLCFHSPPSNDNRNRPCWFWYFLPSVNFRAFNRPMTTGNSNHKLGHINVMVKHVCGTCFSSSVSLLHKTPIFLVISFSCPWYKGFSLL